MAVLYRPCGHLVRSVLFWIRFTLNILTCRRFAAIKPDLSWAIVPGTPIKVKTVSPRLVKPQAAFAIHVHAEDVWGNVTRDVSGLVWHLEIQDEKSQVLVHKEVMAPVNGWTNNIFADVTIDTDGDYMIKTTLHSPTKSIITSQVHLTISSSLSIPRVLFGDLHVHSDDTVGTESSVYNFSYGREIAGLDVLGYTANDFQITHERWTSTLALIKALNRPGHFVLFPGTEWCGNSAAGGDHNVVFLGDPETQQAPEFPLDRNGNVARSFEWSEDGPKDLVPSAWPLDELYATYAHAAENHLLIPHVGGRRCNLAWHHPQLERLVEIGSAWGQFEWLLQDAVRRGWKLGVCANSDEHRGRCGGGVPGTAVFGTRGGLTGILAPELDRASVARSLRARHTFATTGQRLVGLVSTAEGTAIQGDEVDHPAGEPLQLEYEFLGERGFSSIEAFDASGLVWKRDLWSESDKPSTVLRVTWGGARLYDRYREAIWNGTIQTASSISEIEPLGGFEDNPEDTVQSDSQMVTFHSHTSGDVDGVHVSFDALPSQISINGTIDGYVKVGDALAGNPHKAQPNFQLDASWNELSTPGGKVISIRGGCELFVRAEVIPDTPLPVRVQGSVPFTGQGERAIYFVGREWSGEKVVTSPVFAMFSCT